jgi:imidazolonepropionase-like amidohydrolase
MSVRSSWSWATVGTLIDGTDGPPTRQAIVAFDGPRIAWVGSATELGEDTPPDIRDWSALTMIPGIVDVHTHLSLPADGKPYESALSIRDEVMTVIGAVNAARHLAVGVTTVRDNGARDMVGFAIRDAIAAGIVPGPQVLASGRPVTPTGGHFHWCHGVADGPDEIRAAIRSLVADGADHIKIMASGGGTAGSDPGAATYSVPELRVAVGTARELVRLTTAHCRATEGVARAVEAGVDCIEHAEFLRPDGELEFDERVAGRLIEGPAYVSPTLQAFGHYRLRALAAAAAERELTPEESAARARLDAHLDRHLATFNRLLTGGMRDRLVFGTDAGPHVTEFGDVAWGLELMVRGGMSPLEAIRAATDHAAAACGLSDRGAIVAGRRADFVLLEADPTTDVANVGRVAAVFQGGRQVVG